MKAPMSRKDAGANYERRGVHLQPKLDNKANSELCEYGAKRSSGGNYGNEFSVPERKHRNVLPLTSESIKTQTRCRATSKRLKLSAGREELQLLVPSGLRAPD